MQYKNSDKKLTYKMKSVYLMKCFLVNSAIGVIGLGTISVAISTFTVFCFGGKQ